MSRRAKLLTISSILLVIIIALYIWEYAMQTISYTVDSDKITEKFKIVFISDLHNCSYGGSDQSQLMDAIDEASPDIVIFGGDVIDQYGGTDNALTLMSEASENYNCCYCPGNHELKRGDLDEFEEDVAELGVHVLDSDYCQFTINGQEVRVYGVLYASRLKAIEQPIDDSCYNILLAHRPEEIDSYLNKGFDLILSGHAHGGQWRIPHILEQGIYAPDQGLFPDYTNGMFTYGDTVHIISKGLARPLRMILIPRIFNHPEFTIIEIQ